MKAIGIIPALLCGLMFTGMIRAADEEPDLELIEFLGSWEGENDQWQEFFDSVSQVQAPAPEQEQEQEQETVGSDMNDGSKQHDVE